MGFLFILFFILLTHSFSICCQYLSARQVSCTLQIRTPKGRTVLLFNTTMHSFLSILLPRSLHQNPQRTSSPETFLVYCQKRQCFLPFQWVEISPTHQSAYAISTADPPPRFGARCSVEWKIIKLN